MENALLANTDVRTGYRPGIPDFLPVVSSMPGASRIAVALAARELSRAVLRGHPSGREEMNPMATFAAALARLAVAEDISNA